MDGCCRKKKRGLKRRELRPIDKFLADDLPKLDRASDAFEAYEEEILLHVHCHQKELGKCGRYRLCSSGIIRCQGGPREKQLLWYGGFVRDEKGELCDE